MILVEIGNEDAVEGYAHPGEDAVQYRPAEGQRVLTIKIPDETPLPEAVSSIQEVLRNHMRSDGHPVWITSSSATLQATLLKEYNLPDGAGERPIEWGAKVGAF